MPARHALYGAGAGLLVAIGGAFAAPRLPAPIAFNVTALGFCFGCGALALAPVARTMPLPERTALAVAVGFAIAPLAIFLLTVAHAGAAAPALLFAATGAALAVWFRATPAADRGPDPGARWDGWLYAGAAIAAFAITTWVAAGRLTVGADQLRLFGDYDTFDLTFGAAMASELTHRVPPASPFYSGHFIVYSYFPLLLLAAIRNYTNVGMIQIGVGLAWPFFAAVTAAATVAFCRRLGSRPFALLTTALLFGGSSLAYVAAWRWPDMVKLDPLIWSSMFMAPSAEWLYFNAWTPALAVVWATLYALTRADEADGYWWAALATVCLGVLFMFKSFAFIVVTAGLSAAAAVRLLRRDPRARQLIAVVAGACLLTAPWLLSILSLNRVERRAGVTVQWFSLVQRMIFKADLWEQLHAIARPIAGSDPPPQLLLAIATVIFLIGGLGARLIGLATVGRAAGGAAALREWTPLAWIAIVGVALPFAIAVAPFPNSIQAYQLGLFALWPFAAYAVWPAKARPTAIRWVASVLVFAVAVPSTVHYMSAAHAAAAGPQLTSLDASDFRVIRSLRRTDPERTIMLHSNPLWPSLYAVESARRVALAWYSYVAGDGDPAIDARVADIERFFGSPAAPGEDDVSILRKYQVTHVVERTATDRVHPRVLAQLRLLTGTPEVRLYEVPAALLQ